MGSKKHKKHHKSDKKEISLNERQEKPLKLVLKVGGSVQSPVHHTSNSNSSSSQIPRPPQDVKPPVFEDTKVIEKPSSSSHSHEKHKKSKKKKKKKSTDKDKERHDRKRKHHHHHHHHREHSHDRKEKRRKIEESSRSIIESHDSRDSLSMRSLPEPHPIMPMMEKPVRDVRTCTLKKKSMKSPMQILLYYLMKKLQLKDPQEFFAWPVTDVIAPGYSSIITNPIDFSTINKKIDDREYKSVADFKADVKLMCDNAMTYNRQDTIYYKSAKRLLHVAQKLLNKDQLMFLKRSFPYMLELTVEELGFNINDESEESMQSVEAPPVPALLAQPEAKKSKAPPCWSTVEPEEDDDEMSPEEILQQAQRAAKAAADRLTLKRPNSKFGFLRQNENGTTTLSIVHPKSGDKEVKVNLEMLTSKISQGTGTIPGFKEDAKNFVKPINYNNYGPYSTYAPHYDSTFANLSKEDSDLVLSTYGDELGMQYADSLMSFGRESDYITSLADNILDNLTGGEHSKTLKVLEERRILREEEERTRKALKPLNENEINKNSPQPGSCGSDLESFQTLEDYDLELAHLENLDENKKGESDEKLEKRKEILNHRRNFQIKLDKATQLLHDLKKIQNDRLSANPPPHLALVRQPSAAETELAERVSKKLVDVTSQLPPEAIVNIKGLRKAMGITYQPVPTPLSSAKGSRKGSVTPHDMEVERTETPNHDVMLDDNSADLSSDSRHHQPDLDTEFRDFLSAGSSLRICSSPTDS
ncbi:hypothetical protein JTE90_026636 [Oedothorax gibbosus]|uniref:Bromo domain-containing protein n=1 Tax=Oedothorax gibbosus TaxID=931172 RepID=A0AAV6UA00_9ARAC|nr:hypothetical protein JTE90_026636 [Oedothorax gibbosus]